MHVTITAGGDYAGELIVSTTGVLITALLLVLTLRAAKLPGTPLANVVFAACALMWSSGGLLLAAIRASGGTPDGRWALVAQALHFTGGASFPIPVLSIWQPLAGCDWQKRAMGWLRMFACAGAAVVSALLWSAVAFGYQPFPLVEVEFGTAYMAALVLLAGALFALRPRSAPRAIYVPSLAIALAVTAAAAAIALSRHAPIHSHAQMWLGGGGAHLVMLVVICSFFLFARFRYADLFIRYGVRILLAGIWATVLTVTAQSPSLIHAAHQTGNPMAFHVFLMIVVANALLLSFTFVDEQLSSVVQRVLFRHADFRTARAEVDSRIRLLHSETEIAAAIEDAAGRALALASARVVPADSVPRPWPMGLADGELIELERADVMVPITSAGRVSHVLLVSPGGARPRLVSRDLEYLGTIAVQCGRRFDALHREREAVERQSREALLLQQVTEAELRALRAQINPHFLFNSLNTIADLVVRDPARAEAMTLRLAGVFRHVLAHSCRPLTSVRDEVEFLRTYLYIEEARFGDRLQVSIDVTPEIASEHVPSLILQPLVENALKHGLGPKPGSGHLWIRAYPEGGKLCLRVEDDGLGPARHRPTQGNTGLGLANIAERLNTLYHDRASVTLTAREGGGSRATVLIPRGEGGNGV